MADHKGNVPAALVATCVESARCTVARSTTPVATEVDLCEVVSNYLAALPGDPKTGVGTPINEAVCATAPLADYNTHYEIYIAGNNRITVAAPDAEQISGTSPISISVTR
ncbi:MAG: hypothetical protein Q8P29_02140 [Candidatus Levybacteria bacterium]|nr:hypothetical protein [Candidatus Levybacteria bacterium]